MAVIKKTISAENLERYGVFLNDTDPNSKYFKITELPDTFTGGKNAFLIQGSEYLVPDTLIKIEIKDSKGDTIYYEPGEGMISSSVNGESFVTEYYEGTSKVVSVYVYPDTAYGNCTITILGELASYDSNGLISPIPSNWEGQYNVKWQKQVNVNPALANSTKIRFYKRPTAAISEILSPLYTITGGNKVASAVTQSFANIKLSNLETFAGDVKRVKVFRTSTGDISDYDLIQDILVESKELLTTYGLSGSVVGNTGIFTSEVLNNQWNSGSLTASLDSSRVESGVKLSGSGYFTYTQSLNLKSTNTYELNLDAFYSSSVDSNLGIYIISGSTSSSIATLYGTQPTKNLLDTVIPFALDKDYPTASLYLSQSRGDWHVGNISLKLSQDTAFSPDEVSFVTTMPTVLGNETFNFKFEFYDVNNNYVPVAVTQSATFNGGNTNIGGTILLISSSTSASLDALYKVSSSISGTVTFNSSSISGSLTSVSSSISGSIITLSSSVSQSVSLTLSSSLSKVKLLADGGYPGTFIESSSIYSPNIAGQSGYISGKFQVGSTNPIILDATTSTRKIYIGAGTGSNTNTSVYLDSAGQFSLADKLSWNGSALSVNGTINVTGGNAATNTNLSSSLSNTVASSSAAYTNAKAVADSIANGSYNGGTLISNGSIISPVIAGAAGYISSVFKVGSGGITMDGVNKSIYIGSGVYGNTNTGFYVDSTGNFSLKDKLTWDGTTLSVTGNVVITGGSTKTLIDSKITGADVNANVTSIDGGVVTTGTVNTNRLNVSGIISAGGITVNASAGITGGTVGGWSIISTEIQGGSPSGGGDGSYTTAGIRMGASGWISAKNFYIDSSGNASFRGNITATGGTFSGTVTAGSGVTIGPGGITCSGDNQGVDIGGGRGIYSSTGGNIYISGPAGSGVFFVTDSDGLGGMNWGSLSPGRLDIYRGQKVTTALTISAYGGSGDVMYCYGNGGYYLEGTYHQFKPYSGNLALKFVSLPGTNSGLTNIAVDSSGNVYRNTSSAKYKKNIVPVDLEYAKQILNLNVVNFEDKVDSPASVVHTGLIAEEVDKLNYKEWVVYGEDNKPDAINYQSIFNAMLKVVQNLNNRIEELETKLNSK